MALSFNQLIPAWSGTSTATSGAFTPAAQDTIVLFGIDDTNPNAIAQSATNGSVGIVNINGSPSYADADNDLWVMGAQTGAAALPNNLILTGQTGDTIGGIGLDYSGASSVTNGAATEIDAPGTGAAAISGAAVTVPVGSFLLCMVAALSSIDDSATITAANGTPQSRANGTNFGAAITYNVFEYAGTGAPFTPTFGTTKGAGRWIVLQGIVNAATQSAVVAWLR